jgi:hypothetical protein
LLGSTHGTFLNKNKIPSNQFIHVEDGSFLQFAECPQMFVLTNFNEKKEQDDDEEHEDE